MPILFYPDQIAIEYMERTGTGDAAVHRSVDARAFIRDIRQHEFVNLARDVGARQRATPKLIVYVGPETDIDMGHPGGLRVQHVGGTYEVVHARAIRNHITGIIDHYKLVIG